LWREVDKPSLSQWRKSHKDSKELDNQPEAEDPSKGDELLEDVLDEAEVTS
jgi:hypothetical protein